MPFMSAEIGAALLGQSGECVVAGDAASVAIAGMI
jgi:hypothetical protein